MENTVDYSSIQLNFGTIMQKLHSVAIDFAQKKNSAITIENLGFSGDDPKSARFLGGGEYRIVAGVKDESGEIPAKKEFCDVLVEYATWFVGKEQAIYIKEDQLEPIVKTGNSEESKEGQQGSETGEEGTNTGNENTETNNEETGTENKVSESYTKDEKNLLDMIFEADETQQNDNSEDKDATQSGEDSTEGGENQTDSDGEEETDQTQEQPNDNKDDKKEDEQKIIGYSIGYDVEVDGKKEHSVADAIKSKSKGLFGGFLADLRNISIETVGGKKINVGKWTDPAKLKELVGIVDINKDTVAANVKKALDSSFSNNDIDVRVMGNRGSNNGLETYLNRKGKVSPEIKTKLGRSDYSVVVSVNQDDVNYQNYNTKAMAEAATKAFGAKGNKVSEKDVIKVPDINNLYKTKSAYGELTKSEKDKKAKEQLSEDEKVKQPKQKKEESSVKEDTPLEKLVKSEDYKKFVNETIEDECKKELNGEEYTCSYKSTEDITNEMMQDKINDLELLRKIKTGGTQGYCVTISKNLKNSLNESKEEENLLKLIFEDVEDIIREQEEETEKKIQEDSANDTNITGDEKKDKAIQKDIKQQLQLLSQKDKIGEKLTEKAERAIKNAVIRTLDNFKTGKSFEDLKINCFITSVEKQDEEKNVKESLDKSIRSDIKKLYESSEESLTDDDKKLGDKTSKLKGAILDIAKKGDNKSVSPMCAIATSARVIEYMKKHNIGDESIYKELEKKPNCAIVIAKRDFESEDGQKINGGAGNKNLTDSVVNKALDEVCGKDNKMNVINTKNQNKDTMNNTKGDLIGTSLGFYSEIYGKNKKPKNEWHVPELDCWVRPFDINDDKTPKTENLPSDLDITYKWYIVLPDPIPDESKKKGSDGDKDKNKGPQVDWYIIPHKRIKAMGNRPNQETQNADGSTTIKTSDAEYKK